MYFVMDAHSFYDFIYFIFLIIIGSFFMINLCLVVIASQFAETKQRENQLMEEQRARFRSTESTLASFSEPGTCYDEIFKYIDRLRKRSCHLIVRAYRSCEDGGNGSEHMGAHRHSSRKIPHVHHPIHHHHHHHHHYHLGSSTLEMIGEDSQGALYTRGQASARRLGLPESAPGVCDSMHSVYHSGCHINATPQLCLTRSVPSANYSPAVHSADPLPVLGPGCAKDYPSLKECKKLDPDVAAARFTRSQSTQDMTGPAMTFTVSETRNEVPSCKVEGCPLCAEEVNNMDILMDEHGAEDALHDHSRSKKKTHEERNRCYGCLSDVSDYVENIVESKYFNQGIMLAILVNTLSMGIEYHEQPAELTNVLDISNMVFTCIFCLEMLIKILAYGLCGYIRNPYNVFDGIIVIISVWEIVGQAGGGLSVLRTFRLLRVLKLVRFMPALRRQLVVLMKTMDNMATFCMLLLLFIFIFSILGMHLFGCKFSFAEDHGTQPDRKNFDTLLWSVVTVFQILTQEDWNVVLYNGMAATSHWAALYFVVLMTFGNYILFNLLVAILVEGFQAEKGKMIEKMKGEISLEESKGSSASISEDESSTHKEKKKNSTAIAFWQNNSNRSIPQMVQNPVEPKQVGYARPSSRDPVSSDRESLSSRRCRQRSLGSLNGTPALPRRQLAARERASFLSTSRDESLRRAGSLPRQASPSLPTALPDCNGKSSVSMVETNYGVDALREEDLDASAAQVQDEEDVQCCRCCVPQCCKERPDWSLYIFSPSNRFRKTSQTICSNRYFDFIILGIIFLNCITIMLERPSIASNSAERYFLTITNYFFTAIYTTEMIIKVLAMGLIIGPNAYLKSTWNILDGFLVLMSLIDVIVFFASKESPKILGILRVLRLLRTLRPLRVISRAPGLKLVVETLISSLKPIGNIVLICCAFFIIFGILGVQLFKGKFFFCDTDDVTNITTHADCLKSNHTWHRHTYNFDNLGKALMTLFVMSTKDGWVDIMYNGLDAVGVDQQPQRNHNPWMLFFFISFLLIVGFIVLNMFVGVVVENFQNCRQQQEEEEAQHLEELRQRRLQKKLKRAAKPPYWAKYSAVRRYIHRFCTSSYLELSISIIIGLNVLTMSVEHFKQPEQLYDALRYCNYIFTAVFILEALLKLVALGIWRFFKDRLNQLDIAIVILSIVGIILEEMKMNLVLPLNPTIIRIMRVLRIARVLKLLKAAKGMRALLHTVMLALPQVGNLGLLFMLLFFIYAALGVELFGELVCTEETPCDGLGRYASFRNFGMALLTLFRISTGDNWNGILKDTLRSCADDLVESEHGCCGYDAIVSPIYFVTFVLLTQFVLVNVVVAVLMKHLEESNKEMAEEAEAKANEEHDEEMQRLRGERELVGDGEANCKEKDGESVSGAVRNSSDKSSLSQGMSVDSLELRTPEPGASIFPLSQLPPNYSIFTSPEHCLPHQTPKAQKSPQHHPLVQTPSPAWKDKSERVSTDMRMRQQPIRDSSSDDGNDSWEGERVRPKQEACDFFPKTPYRMSASRRSPATRRPMSRHGSRLQRQMAICLDSLEAVCSQTPSEGSPFAEEAPNCMPCPSQLSAPQETKVARQSLSAELVLYADDVDPTVNQIHAFSSSVPGFGRGHHRYSASPLRYNLRSHSRLIGGSGRQDHQRDNQPFLRNQGVNLGIKCNNSRANQNETGLPELRGSHRKRKPNQPTVTAEPTKGSYGKRRTLLVWAGEMGSSSEIPDEEHQQSAHTNRFLAGPAASLETPERRDSGSSLSDPPQDGGTSPALCTQAWLNWHTADTWVLSDEQASKGPVPQNMAGLLQAFYHKENDDLLMDPIVPEQCRF
uniref:Voltage-dependent T-type calcium channel subunit alpha n=1 Tax=Eptatretus burgeri TaxID=7764 RepID=A0A8C4PW99_EPTBU